MNAVIALTFLVVAGLLGMNYAISCKAGPYDLTPIQGKQLSYQWHPSDQGTAVVAICGTLNQVVCGTLPDQMCYEKNSGCALACQTWMDDASGPQGAALGTQFQSITPGDNSVTLLYTGGDQTDDGTGRQVYVTVNCGTDDLAFQSFVQADPSNPPPQGQPYSFYINVTSKYACKNTCKYPTCDRCADESGCAWCLDSNKCTSLNSKASCSNYIRSNKYCPYPSGKCATSTTCSNCTKTTDPYGNCAWCISSSFSRPYCAEADTVKVCDQLKVTKPAFCPSN